MFSVRNYATLPTDPKALLRKLKTPYPNQVGATTDSDVFEFFIGITPQPRTHLVEFIRRTPRSTKRMSQVVI